MLTTDEKQRTDTRLLVVEDEPNILELLSASLRYAGFDVVTAAAGTEAVQAAHVVDAVHGAAPATRARPVPIMESRVTRLASFSSLQPSVPSGRIGTTR